MSVVPSRTIHFDVQYGSDDPKFLTRMEKKFRILVVVLVVVLLSCCPP